jgi:hypothetical protein
MAYECWKTFTKQSIAEANALPLRGGRSRLESVQKRHEMNKLPVMSLLIASAATPWIIAESRQAYGSLRTPWAGHVSQELPLPEYPRPQLVREGNWINLNGQWDYAVKPAGAGRPGAWEGKILVPFAIESQLSGVQRMVGADEELWYRRTFERPEGERVLLHFGAVDWRSTVWVNGQEVGKHEGGYTPFHFDITAALEPSGEQELIVRVWDPTDSEPQPRGKQVRQPHGIYYTPVTGIWQTVWIEGVPAASIAHVQPQSDIGGGVIRVTVEGRGTEVNARARVTAFDAGRSIGSAEGRVGSPIELAVPDARLWTPDAPHLYDLEVELIGGGDRVKSYFAMREVSYGKDEYGIHRILLNREPLFHYGFLDQGFWPDGLYTAPTDEALRWDIEITRKMGFNMARKHVKVEPARWYRHADELGLLVWQDMPSGSSQPSQNAHLGSGKDGVMPEEWRRNFRNELRAMIDALRFFPSVVVWIPFNEGWGQHDTNNTLKWVADYDTTRLVGGPSGWEDLGWGHLKDMHAYPGPGMYPAVPDRVSVLGEYGGLGLVVKGHLWQEDRNWGYQSFATPEELLGRYGRLIEDLRPLIEEGLAAAVYTQTTDVEIEVNGLITYDRRFLKIDPEVLAELHRPLYEPHPPMRNHSILATAETEAQEWSFTTTPPSAGWEQPEFDATTWQRGKSGFGTPGTPGAIVGTRWETEDIWLRREFTLPQMDFEELYLRIHHDEDVVIFLNGTKVLERRGYRTTYRNFRAEGVALGEVLRPGKNTVAVHCHQTAGGQFMDFGLVQRVPREAEVAAGRE